MNCPKCNQPIEPGAVFCGNCGQPLQATTTQPTPNPAPSQPVIEPTDPANVSQPSSISPMQQVLTNQQSAPGVVSPINFGNPAAAVSGGSAPVGAIAQPVDRSGETKSIIALLLGVAGIPGALFIPLIGIVFGLAGIILASIARQHYKHALSRIAIFVSALALVVAIVITVIGTERILKSRSNNAASSSSSQTATTPCYGVVFAGNLTVTNTSGSCVMSAANADRSIQYNIDAANNPAITESNFNSAVPTTLKNAFNTADPNAVITSQHAGTFAGSTAYYMAAKDTSTKDSAEVVAVLHAVSHGENFFILSEDNIGGGTPNLQSLETNWTWK